MFLHLGNDYMVDVKDIVGIFDIENTSVSKITKDFLNDSSKRNQIVNCTYEMPKSFVVCLDKDLTEKIYISQMSCATLLKRFKKPVDENNYKSE
ncbi:MAG: extracellular matrix regulator RemB [Oscillospiraceae bacterium]